MSTTTKKVTNKFVKAVLSEMNKTEQQKQQEAVENFVEDGVIDCNTQLALLKTSELPKAEQVLAKAKVELARAEKAFEKSRFSLASNFEQYVEARELALDAIDSAKQTVSGAEQSIKNVKARIETFESILADLS